MSSADRVRHELEQDIVTGALEPGDRLDEVALAERFSVSRTPVREALRRLASSGLVELRPRRGASVREVGLTELVQMFEVMAELEGMCGRLAARRITPVRAAALETSLAACVEAAERGDPDRYYDANAEFHALIYEASQNGFLADQAQALHTRLAPYRRLQLRVVHRMNQSLAEHREITEAICSGDASRAEDAVEAHVAIQGERFSDLVSTFASAD